MGNINSKKKNPVFMTFYWGCFLPHGPPTLFSGISLQFLLRSDPASCMGQVENMMLGVDFKIWDYIMLGNLKRYSQSVLISKLTWKSSYWMDTYLRNLQNSLQSEKKIKMCMIFKPDSWRSEEMSRGSLCKNSNANSHKRVQLSGSKNLLVRPRGEYTPF